MLVTYWSYAFFAAVYLVNRLPTPTLSGANPYEKLFHQAPNYLKLQVFGCLCYPWLRLYTTNNLACRSTPCIFLGYSLAQSVFLCLDPNSTRIYVSHHVQFIEDKFSFQTLSSPPPKISLVFSSWISPISIISTLPHHTPSSYEPLVSDPSPVNTTVEEATAAPHSPATEYVAIPPSPVPELSVAAGSTDSILAVTETATIVPPS